MTVVVALLLFVGLINLLFTLIEMVLQIGLAIQAHRELKAIEKRSN